MKGIDYEHHFTSKGLLETFDNTLVDPKDQIRSIVLMQLNGWLENIVEDIRAGSDFKIRLVTEAKAHVRGGLQTKISDNEAYEAGRRI